MSLYFQRGTVFNRLRFIFPCSLFDSIKTSQLYKCIDAALHFGSFLPLEDKAIFVLDGNKEGISRYVAYPIAAGMMLNFDNDCLELTYIPVEQERPEKGVIIPAFPFVADEDSHYSALIDSL